MKDDAVFVGVIVVMILALLSYGLHKYTQKENAERAACEARGGYLMVSKTGPNVCIDRKSIK